jgi:hypothetical protein
VYRYAGNVGLCQHVTGRIMENSTEDRKLLMILSTVVKSFGGPLMVAQWLRYCATNRKVAGSIPDGVIVIFH